MEDIVRKRGLEFGDLLNTILAQADPLDFLARYLQEQRLPGQGRFFYDHAYAAFGVHGSVIILVIFGTSLRALRGRLWFTRRQQGRLRLNATVITMLFLALYSTLAIVYTSLLLYQQWLHRYLAGSAAFQLSCFSPLSFAVAIIAFTYHQSLPVGFEGSILRKMFGRKNAAADRRIFGFPLLCIWLVVSLAGIMAFAIIHDYWRRRADQTIHDVVTYLDRPEVREQGISALLGIADQLTELSHAKDEAQQSLRRQILVYMGHLGLYLVVILPVAFKLISLVGHQIGTLRRSADDYFKLESRQEQAGIAAHYPSPQGHNATPESAWATKSAHSKNLQPLICNHCGHAAVFAPAFPAKKREVTHAIKPQGFTAADMPLVKVKRLKEVRVELCTFSAIIAFACLNFLAWGTFIWIKSERWESADITAYCFAIFLWSYGTPAVLASAFYAYTTLLLPKVPSNVGGDSTGMTRFRPKSRNIQMASQGHRQQLHHTTKPDYDGYSLSSPQAPVRRTEPTFPRLPSVISLGVTEAADVQPDRSQTESYYMPARPSPVVCAEDERKQTSYWIRSLRRASTKTASVLAHTFSVPSAYASDSQDDYRHPTMPVNMNMSWLEIEEDEICESPRTGQRV